MRARHGDARWRARPRRRASRGSASVEYGLIVGLIGAVLCLGIGVAVKSVFQNSLTCLMAQLQGQSAPPGCDGGAGGGGGGSGDTGGDGVTPGTTPSPSPSTSPSPSPSATAEPIA